MLSSGEGEKLKKIINIDGKTMRESGNKHQNPLHVVSAWSKEAGISLGQTVVGTKENEIVAIPKLLERLRLNGSVITIDAMGTQTEIAKQITKQKGDYVLAVKGNQPTLHQDIIDYFADDGLLAVVKKSGNYKCTVEKARGQIEKREYYQTDDIQWMVGKADWSKLTSIGMVEKTIDNDGKIAVERRYFISSLTSDIELFERAVRGHWAIESMHWHLDVTFREDFNATLDRQAALNLNILRKLCLSILRLLDIGRPRASLKLKRKAISWNPMKFLAEAIAL
jgi:predicted transposase YbfD/YdcC